MAGTKVGVITLLLCATILLGLKPEHASAKVCPFFCYAEVAYMTCPPAPYKKLGPVCNCCLAKPGCKLFRADGTVICTAS
ncbi:unnamed protein product [Coffea canephora]|uniref:DH200=94 genomic scaffold, scaffold_1871 n=1 Tax=Coffea canephora TaxID=49390 RepID=A0A068VJU5_COFCA|nr:proteinase inhibitor PSI-1.2-like [Coffea arabica]CDP20849.1 unnamed protein product [Coffea canephora]